MLAAARITRLAGRVTKTAVPWVGDLQPAALQAEGVQRTAEAPGKLVIGHRAEQGNLCGLPAILNPAAGRRRVTAFLARLHALADRLRRRTPPPVRVGAPLAHLLV